MEAIPENAPNCRDLWIKFLLLFIRYGIKLGNPLEFWISGSYLNPKPADWIYVFQFFMEIRIRPIVIISLKLLDFWLKGNPNPLKCQPIFFAIH